jgi:hypothetical protein
MVEQHNRIMRVIQFPPSNNSHLLQRSVVALVREQLGSYLQQTVNDSQYISYYWKWRCETLNLVLDVSRKRTALILKGTKVHSVTSQKKRYFNHREKKTQTLATWHLFTPRTNRQQIANCINTMHVESHLFLDGKCHTTNRKYSIELVIMIQSGNIPLTAALQEVINCMSGNLVTCWLLT